MTERCINCGLFAGQDYGTDYYRLKDFVFCSISCYNYLEAIKLNEPKHEVVIKKSKAKKKKAKSKRK